MFNLAEFNIDFVYANIFNVYSNHYSIVFRSINNQLYMYY